MTYYDQISKGYSELHEEEQLNKIKIIKENLDIKPTDLMLDVGCGPYFGDFKCKVIGLDPSIELLKLAVIPVVQGRAESLPFAKKSFDIVVSITAIQNFNDINKAFQEMGRVSKGICVLTFLKKSQKLDSIEELIMLNFEILKRIEEDKDIILITKYKNNY